jgi:hypothetical protein
MCPGLSFTRSLYPLSVATVITLRPEAAGNWARPRSVVAPLVLRGAAIMLIGSGVPRCANCEGVAARTCRALAERFERTRKKAGA